MKTCRQKKTRRFGRKEEPEKKAQFTTLSKSQELVSQLILSLIDQSINQLHSLVFVYTQNHKHWSFTEGGNRETVT